ncbi:GIY-YIG nuclease family protein [Candidatus Kuenenbacteria bacterium]|nr:GIY-YIG nuclease family protein [Candidatus Kuenenbacteria bacterium]
MSYFIYFIRSLRNNKIYVGSTGQLVVKRLEQHNIGLNKWTKENGPFELLYYERYYCKKDVLQREIFYKSGFGRRIRDCIISSVSAIGGSAYG